MAGIYEYRTIKIAPGRQVSEVVRASASAMVPSAGGSVYGLWSGLIGAGSDEAVLMTYWPDAELLAQGGARTIGSLDGVLESHFARLVPALRPSTATPPSETGVYAFRWFGLRTARWPELLELSERSIWPWIESQPDCRVLGVWRNMDVAPPEARALSVTTYPDMAAWDRTRVDSVSAPDGADAQLYSSARTAARARASLTEWTIVRIFRLIPFT